MKYRNNAEFPKKAFPMNKVKGSLAKKNQDLTP